MKEFVIDLLKQEVSLDEATLMNMVEVPPKLEMGDFAFPCFSLAKEFKKSPSEIAVDLCEKLRKDLGKEVSGVDSTGPYVNFFMNKAWLAQRVLAEVKRENWGQLDSLKGTKIIIDMSSPNIGKPFGIGHLRSTIIGEALNRISMANGATVSTINHLGDWGGQYGKLNLAYLKWGDADKLAKDPIGHLQELYVRVSADKSLVDESREAFARLEQGDIDSVTLWEKFRELSIIEFDKIYDLLDVSFTEIGGESLYNKSMASVVALLKEKGLLILDDGALVVDLKEEGLGVVLIEKSNGTSTYITRDIAAALDRYDRYSFDQAIYEVGTEQSLHFKQLFTILKKMGNSWADNCVHVGHGLYLDKDGKKFSTRRGKTVYMQDVVDETISSAYKNLEEKTLGLSKKELDHRSRVIALAAIKYGDLKHYRDHNMVFDLDRFLAFEGDTGPYLLYSFARASSILNKSRSKAKIEIIDLKDVEILLLKAIDSYPEVISQAYSTLTPSVIASYSYNLAKLFNEFYHSCPVLGGTPEGFRLALVDAFRITLEKSLDLLGIEVLEEM